MSSGAAGWPAKVDLLGAASTAGWIRRRRRASSCRSRRRRKRRSRSRRRVRCGLYPSYPRYKGEGDPNEASSFTCAKTVTQRSWVGTTVLGNDSLSSSHPRMDLRDFAQFHLPALEADESPLQCADRRHHGGCEGIAIGLLPTGHWERPAMRYQVAGTRDRACNLERAECQELVQTVLALDYPGVVGADKNRLLVR